MIVYAGSVRKEGGDAVIVVVDVPRRPVTAIPSETIVIVGGKALPSVLHGVYDHVTL